MATLKVYDEAGGEVGTYEIDTTQIADRINKQLLHDAVVMYQANLRQGTHSAKTRGEVAGSTKKMYRQKGTGNARAGSRRTNIRRGGGVARTIKPRDYSYRMNRKSVRLATRMAIRSKIDDGELVVVDKLGFRRAQDWPDGFCLESSSDSTGPQPWSPRLITTSRFTRAVVTSPVFLFSRFANSMPCRCSGRVACW